jgi:GT2 family glycosyltransferase
MKKTRKIVIATPFYDHHGWSPYIKSLAVTTYFAGRYLDNLELDFWALDGDAYVWRARNQIAKRFKESDYDELVFIDSDEEWKVEGFIKLLSRDVPIVGAGYPCKNNWDFYGCIIDTDSNGYPIVTDDGLIQALIVPTGFMKIKKEVFLRLDAAFPESYYIGEVNGEKIKTMNYFGHLLEEHQPYGEDTSFCIRCKRAGIPVYVEPDITIKHYGTKAWEGNYHEFLLSQPRHDEAQTKER